MAAEGYPVRSTATLLRVSESGYYAWRRRDASVRLQRHAWLTELILSIHQSSKGAYGSRRIHHELQQCYDVSVSRGTVELLMRRAGIRGQTGRSRWAAPQTLDDRAARRLWVTDARAHPTPTGTLYCAVVLDIDRHRLMGWSTERAATHELVGRALNAAVTGDAAQLPPILPHRTRWTTYAFTERAQALVLSPKSALASDQHVQVTVNRFWRKVDHHLPPRQHWNSPEDLLEELKRLLEALTSHKCRFDESCSCNASAHTRITSHPKTSAPQIPAVIRFAPS
ncbi:IS3 family transposase [Streptomyces adustus]|uniref:IS3 family transposase n=1 Tax=Streptomyces adustus TaxID=1609272 RepID=UPI0037118D62